MNRYGTTQCATNLAACSRVGKNMQEQYNRVHFPQRQTKGKNGNLCESSMQHQTTENRDSQNKINCRRKSYILSRRIQHVNIRLNHHETSCKQCHLRKKIKIHIHGRKVFYLNNHMDRSEYIMIQISIISQYCLEKYNHKEKSHNEYFFEQVTKRIYGIQQSGRIAHDVLVKHLEPYG